MFRKLHLYIFLLIPGQFYAPEQAGERVLSLNSDQTKNTILVSGDTSGWLQIWEICHFALEIQHEVMICVYCNIWSMRVLHMPIYLRFFLSSQPGCERPPMMRCWKAHKRAIVSVEVLEVADRLFILTASADGSAGLWTVDGDHVGCFGQKMTWNMTEPATYQR